MKRNGIFAEVMVEIEENEWIKEFVRFYVSENDSVSDIEFKAESIAMTRHPQADCAELYRWRYTKTDKWHKGLNY